LMVVMLLGGLWHGAAWTYVVWGGIHGLLLVVHRLWVLRRPATPRRWTHPLRVLAMFHAANVAYIFFRAPSLREAWEVLGNLASPFAGVDGSALALLVATGLITVLLDRLVV